SGGATPTQSAPNQPISLTAQFNLINSPGSPAPTGSVTFEATPVSLGYGLGYGTPIVLGSTSMQNNLSATLQTIPLGAGDYVITAVYSGDANYAENIGWFNISLTAGQQFSQGAYTHAANAVSDAYNAYLQNPSNTNAYDSYV